MKQKLLLISFESDLLWVLLLMLGSFGIGYGISAYLQKRKYLSLSKKLKSELDAYKKTSEEIKNIDVLFSEIKPKIVEVVKETQNEMKGNRNNTHHKEFIARRAKESFINETAKSKKELLDFNRIGFATPADKDDLTKIIGIGPYIEQRLNKIGIYTYEQISHLNTSDIKVITELIDFFPQRIEKDNWIGQAESLKFA